MKEADFQTRFGQRLREGKLGFVELFRLYPPNTSGFAFELKLSLTGRALNISSVKEHQLTALDNVNSRVSSDSRLKDAQNLCVSSDGGGLYLKLTDLSMGSKPFDCVYLSGGIGRLILGWHDRGKRTVRAYSMTVGAWRALAAQAQAAGRGSVTEAMVAGAAEGMVEV